MKKPYDWNYTTAAQPGFNGRRVPYPQGKVLGGTSSTSRLFFDITVTSFTFQIFSDSMVYTTGSRDDWDYISRITEDPAWAWDAMSPYRDLNQKYVAPNDDHDDVSRKRVSSFFPPFLPFTSDKSIPSVCTQS